MGRNRRASSRPPDDDRDPRASSRPSEPTEPGLAERAASVASSAGKAARSAGSKLDTALASVAEPTDGNGSDYEPELPDFGPPQAPSRSRSRSRDSGIPGATPPDSTGMPDPLPGLDDDDDRGGMPDPLPESDDDGIDRLF